MVKSRSTGSCGRFDCRQRLAALAKCSGLAETQFLVLSELGKIAREAEQDSHFQGMSSPDLTASL